MVDTANGDAQGRLLRWRLVVSGRRRQQYHEILNAAGLSPLGGPGALQGRYKVSSLTNRDCSGHVGPFTLRPVSAIPLGRIHEAYDLVGPAVFLASDAASMVTGALLPADGGNLAMNAGTRADE
jgi:hypothetical protein